MPNKYRAQPTVIDGVRFASRREGARYLELVLLQRAGVIQGLEVHPIYRFEHNGIKIGRYTGDFRYQEAGALVVEDVKSPASRTEAYVIRKRLMLAFHAVEIREVYA